MKDYPFRPNGIKIGINLNYDWTTLLHFLFQPERGPKWKRINNQILVVYSFSQTSTFECQLENVWITCHFFNEIASRPFETSNKRNHGGRVGRWSTDEVSQWCHRIVRGLCAVWNNMNSTTFATDEQNVLSVSSKRCGKLGCRVNSLPFCETNATSHVSS